MSSTHFYPGSAPVELGAIESLVKQGKTVISTESSATIEWVMKLIEEQRTATLYLKTTMFNEIMKKRWPEELAKKAGLQPISEEQIARIKNELGIELDGYANTIICPRCGTPYSTYEFIQQGFREHGEEAVRAVFALKGIAVLQVHPMQNPVCMVCRMVIVLLPDSGQNYCYIYRCNDGNGYGCG